MRRLYWIAGSRTPESQPLPDQNATIGLPSPREQLSYFQKREAAILDSIRQLVEIESPSDVKQAVDRLSSVMASRFRELGGAVRLHQVEKFGNHLQIDFKPARSGRDRPLLLLGHMDTVYPIGTIRKMPCRVAKGRIWGPGVLDMKAGIALTLEVIEALEQWNHGRVPRPITILLVSDEEIGSHSSRPLTEHLARQSSAVLVLEPAAGLNGAVKTARKGIGEYRVEVRGRAAHAGLDFEKGESAILELARQISAIAKLVNRARGITLNVGVVRGGTRVNVVAAEATAEVDVRVKTMKDAATIDRRLKSLQPFNRGCQLRVRGGVNRPPMERTPGVAELYDKARRFALELGWKLDEAAVGGGSDGNFTASLGIPTLDGLGAVGEGAHADDESVLVGELARRAALLSSLIARI